MTAKTARARERGWARQRRSGLRREACRGAQPLWVLKGKHEGEGSERGFVASERLNLDQGLAAAGRHRAQ